MLVFLVAMLVFLVDVLVRLPMLLAPSLSKVHQHVKVGTAVLLQGVSTTSAKHTNMSTRNSSI